MAQYYRIISQTMLFISSLTYASCFGNKELPVPLKPFQIGCQIFDKREKEIAKFERMEIGVGQSYFSIPYVENPENNFMSRLSWELAFSAYPSKSCLYRGQKMKIKQIIKVDEDQVTELSPLKVKINKKTNNVDHFAKVWVFPVFDAQGKTIHKFSKFEINTIKCQPLEYQVGYDNSVFAVTDQEKKYLTVLDLPFVRNLDAVKRRYRDLALTHHPDKTKDEVKRAQFVKIAEAKKYLESEWSGSINNLQPISSRDGTKSNVLRIKNE